MLVLCTRVSDAAFTSGRDLTIDAAEVSGASGSLNDFPVVVSLTDRDLRTIANQGRVASTNGWDIVFRAYDVSTCGGPASCTLDHEIETYDPVTGELVAWVRIPVLSKSSDTTITMHFGDATIVAPTENPLGVWDVNHRAVWHLEEDPGPGGAGDIRDSTGNGNHGTAHTSMTSTDQVAGQANGAIDFDGLDDQLTAGSGASIDNLTTISIQGWIFLRSFGGGGLARILQKGSTNLNHRAFHVVSTGQLNFSIGWSTAPSQFACWRTPVGSVSLNTWHHVAVTYDYSSTANQPVIYVDGAALPLTVVRAPGGVAGSDAASTLYVGNRASGGRSFDGVIDELRVSGTLRSPDWIATSRANQQGPYPFFRPTIRFRSIGTDASVLANAGTLSLANGSTTVTFTNPLPAVGAPGAVGRGDEIVVDGEIFHVVSRLSDTSVTVDHASATDHLGSTYTIRRVFNDLQSWETGREGDLVAGNLIEAGVAFHDGDFTAGANISGSTADANHFMLLTVADAQRHDGTANGGAIVNGAGQPSTTPILIDTPHTKLLWLRVANFNEAGASAGITVNGGATQTELSNLLIYDFATNFGDGVQSNADFTIRNSIVYNGLSNGVVFQGASAGTIDNVTIYNVGGDGVRSDPGTTSNIRNTISMVSGGADFNVSASGTQSNNMSADLAAPGAGSLTGRAAATQFIALTPGSEDLHLRPGADAIDQGADLSSSFCCDIEAQSRPADLGWDMGADEINGVTAVELVDFRATSFDRAVVIEWQTSSELDNLGFHVYRRRLPDGALERITSSVVPGLGSSPSGARYRYRDTNVVNGRTYAYELEDVDTFGRTERHGPVTASPSADHEEPAAPAEDDGGQTQARITFGRPERNELHVVRRTVRGVELELRTEGFYADVLEDGSLRLSIPQFVDLEGDGALLLPVRRHWLDAVAGRKVRLVSARALDQEWVLGLTPDQAPVSELIASRSGEVRLRQRERPARRRLVDGIHPARSARLVDVGFQRDKKKALVEFAPLRWNAAVGRLLWSKRIRVRVSFRGREPSELSHGGSRGRKLRTGSAAKSGDVLVRLVVKERGLYAVRYEELFGRRRRSFPVSLSRKGEGVPYRLEPAAPKFGPRSTLYFFTEGAELNPYGDEAVYELSVGAGKSMDSLSVAPSSPGASVYRHRLEQEENRLYQAGLVDAPDLWLWDAFLAPVQKTYAFDATSVAPGAARLSVWLQGVTDFPTSSDHHVLFRVNDRVVGEARWNGREPYRIDANVDAGVVEGKNVLAIENVGDTDALYSMVLLNRFSIDYPRFARATTNQWEGEAVSSGALTVARLGPETALLELSDGGPRWLDGATISESDGLTFRAERDRRYLAVDTAALKRPVLRQPLRPRLRTPRRRADYVAIGPEAFLTTLRPLFDRRRRQGLKVQTASVEQVVSEFGHGESSPEAIRQFLLYAYHHWRAPSLRYVLLVGDTTYDPEDRMRTGVVDHLPSPTIQTSHLWTVSDVRYAALNGDDALPDVAIGRLPAANRQELDAMMRKILAHERREFDPTAPVVLVADNADGAGDFEADARELARGVLAGRPIEEIYLSELGAGRSNQRIVRAFNEGASLVSYLGHGGIDLWAAERIFTSADVAQLNNSDLQPLLVTMNCLNGYFHFPFFDSLSEALLKAPDKGIVAAVSPTGLSLNGPAHRFHRALVDELLHGGHRRVGDAVLAAQERYADSGAYPEILDIYHLLGDPAMPLR